VGSYSKGGKSMKKFQTILLTILTIGVVILIAIQLGFKMPSNKSEEVQNCESIVKEHLKCPETAIFKYDEYDESNNKSYDEKEDTFVFRGKVSSQNGFGALVSDSWTVMYQHKDGVMKPVLLHIGDEYIDLETGLSLSDLKDIINN
jgi:hypothetical protein